MGKLLKLNLQSLIQVLFLARSPHLIFQSMDGRSQVKRILSPFRYVATLPDGTHVKLDNANMAFDLILFLI